MFEFNIKKKNTYIWVNLIGKLISDEDATNMMDTLSSELSAKNKYIILNLKELNYINSSGFNNFLKLLTLSRNMDGDTILCNSNNNINQLLITTKLNTIFKTEKEINSIEDYLNKK
jgi:anti-anti-sigma factor